MQKEKAYMIEQIVGFIADIVKNRSMLNALAKNDLKAKFAASFLGVIWAFIQPLVTILVFWVVFQLGFRNPPVDDVPFILWFIPSYLVWTFFTEGLLASSGCLMEYSYLVKKVNFRVSIIPLVKVLSSLFVHVGFILFIYFMYGVYRVPITIYNIQIIYYLFCTVVLLTGLAWLLSSLAPFIKDITNVVNVFVQIGFWLTPIFWSPDSMNPIVKRFLQFNPMYYICQGYRDCFIYQEWFWDRGIINLYFWIFTIMLFFLGVITFKRLRPYFADEI